MRYDFIFMDFILIFYELFLLMLEGLGLIDSIIRIFHRSLTMGCIEDVVGEDYDVELKWTLHSNRQMLLDLGNNRSFKISYDEDDRKFLLTYETPTDIVKICDNDNDIMALMTTAEELYIKKSILLEIRK